MHALTVIGMLIEVCAVEVAQAMLVGGEGTQSKMTPIPCWFR
jgi:hypothetical protein